MRLTPQTNIRIYKGSRFIIILCLCLWMLLLTTNLFVTTYTKRITNNIARTHQENLSLTQEKNVLSSSLLEFTSKQIVLKEKLSRYEPVVLPESMKK